MVMWQGATVLARAIEHVFVPNASSATDDVGNHVG